jgi:uncharacterized protein (TIGR03435 family)
MRAAIFSAVVVSSVMFAQPTAGPSFEVASVKLAPPLSPDKPIMVGMRGGPGTNDPGRATYNSLSLKQLLQNAYGLKPYQISGPAWLETERYDVVAKVPEGATKEQFAVMLQNLLVERFGLKFHREMKELPLYELAVAKNGSKLKPAAPAPSGAPDAAPPVGPPPIGKDGFPQLPPGRPNMIMMARPGQMRMAATMQPMDRIADMLGNQLGTAVVDKTGLTGKYDFTLEFALDPGKGLLPGLPPPPPPPPGGGGDGGPPRAVGFATDPSDAPSLINAVQEQLGLRLEKKKGPLELMVVDRAEKTPTEN